MRHPFDSAVRSVAAHRLHGSISGAKEPSPTRPPPIRCGRRLLAPSVIHAHEDEDSGKPAAASNSICPVARIYIGRFRAFLLAAGCGGFPGIWPWRRGRACSRRACRIHRGDLLSIIGLPWRRRGQRPMYHVGDRGFPCAGVRHFADSPLQGDHGRAALGRARGQSPLHGLSRSACGAAGREADAWRPCG